MCCAAPFLIMSEYLQPQACQSSSLGIILNAASASNGNQFSLCTKSAGQLG